MHLGCETAVIVRAIGCLAAGEKCREGSGQRSPDLAMLQTFVFKILDATRTDDS